MKKQLEKWLSEISRFCNPKDFVNWTGGECDGKEVVERFKLYTRDHAYAIVAKQSDKKSYLGCVASARKPRAGEDWTRGRDLADGDFSQETWNKIKNDILSFELVKIAKKQRIESIPEVTGPSIEPDASADG